MLLKQTTPIMCASRLQDILRTDPEIMANADTIRYNTVD